jgi:excinuclease ABC subunit C
MAPKSLRVDLERPSGIPTEPGVYRFRDSSGTVIYVGKAINLRSRISSYFAGSLAVRTAAMMSVAAQVDWVVVRNEAEALILEYSWIKEFDPRFNVKYRDDKSYPYVAVTLNEDFPRFGITRENHRKGVRYFGPYAHVWAIRETVDQLQWVFPIRSCRDGVYRRAKKTGRPCLLGYIDKCSAPCVDRITASDYRTLVDQFCNFLAGGSQQVLTNLSDAMHEAAAAEKYEDAARLRDRIDALRQALERNVVALGDGVEADVIAMVDDTLEMGVQVFHVRDGMVIGERGFVVEKDEDHDLPGYADRVLQHIYAESTLDIPREVLVSTEPSTASAWEEILSERRGSMVDVRVPQRGSKATLMGLVMNNARETLLRHQRDRSRDLNTRSAALRELQDALDLPESPLRIECIDISTLQGKDTVGALVVFEDALPRKKDYRSYIVDQGADDVSAIREVVSRRFRSVQADSPYRPGLLVVDGGLPQVRAAAAALDDVGAGDIPVIGLAKRLEEIWRPTGDPVILSRRSEALYLLQRIRDEAHRRAIGLHRGRRANSTIASALDDIPGLGPQRARTLLRRFGSVKRLREAPVEQLAEVPGVGPVLAERIHQHLSGVSRG